MRLTALEQFESMVRRLIEVNLARLFPFQSTSELLARKLIETMRGNLHEKEGILVAPQTYIIRLPTSLTPDEFGQKDLIDALTHALATACHESKIHFPGLPIIEIQPDNSLQPGEVRIFAREKEDFLRETREYVVGMPMPGDELSVDPIPDAYLIINSIDFFQIEERSIKIGRSPENQLVLEDPTVAPLHAQLRLFHGSFILFHLDTASSTLVNGQIIVQKVLKTGDVINLGQTILVFGQEDQRDTHETQPIYHS